MGNRDWRLERQVRKKLVAEFKRLSGIDGNLPLSKGLWLSSGEKGLTGRGEFWLSASWWEMEWVVLSGGK